MKKYYFKLKKYVPESVFLCMEPYGLVSPNHPGNPTIEDLWWMEAYTIKEFKDNKRKHPCNKMLNIDLYILEEEGTYGTV